MCVGNGHPFFPPTADGLVMEKDVQPSQWKSFDSAHTNLTDRHIFFHETSLHASFMRNLIFNSVVPWNGLPNTILIDLFKYFFDRKSITDVLFVHRHYFKVLPGWTFFLITQMLM